MKTILFIHCAGSQRSDDLVHYLKQSLSSEHNVAYPEMPNPEAPEYDQWVKQVEKELSFIDGEVILVGHSLGGAVLVKYLSEKSPPLPQVTGLYLIAPPFWGRDEEWQNEAFTITDPSTLPSIDRVVLYHSRSDHVVPSSHQTFYREIFPNAIIRTLNGNDHFFIGGLPELVADLKQGKS
ncbi:alpha/beta hydrolase [Halalkalibacterium halodurans]|uniref:BH0848 protein n=1 Tax=Halalkalibacterium halodurans (strain ATCC BAA-125 / DSM 18197 / FERM 7344 / JCM 9153 / C-125) TaxID=272558 RepID=Q9KEK4_HALH5|nr:alpha/beta hydrolase [Halalkalibacterium halodurans]MDY7221346.1 alpha/beta hydrolase [Halalkalibacterium halodurans]MDY7240585.1 alpha/beta hydrolase [Halalkalibacterium halodurans]MED4080788.1 alpha/beta hydrolase [Halalkalibacterium halodurans]MED4086245.1 alpha/beta hydrolase [Halalkalibacterium halodurans]MED4106927.1 alpha/beta hydrolase [Halalkalibacterium halodurans]